MWKQLRNEAVEALLIHPSSFQSWIFTLQSHLQKLISAICAIKPHCQLYPNTEKDARTSQKLDTTLQILTPSVILESEFCVFRCPQLGF